MFSWVNTSLYAALIALMVFAGWKLHSAGYQKAEAEWTIKYQTRENELLRAAAEERIRQAHANDEAKRREAERIAEMERWNRELEGLVKELEDEAAQDADAGRVCLSDDSRMRINRVR